MSKKQILGLVGVLMAILVIRIVLKGSSFGVDNVDSVYPAGGVRPGKVAILPESTKAQTQNKQTQRGPAPTKKQSGEVKKNPPAEDDALTEGGNPKYRGGADDPLKHFVNDPSFEAHCSKHTVPPLKNCPPRSSFEFADRTPYVLRGPISQGATTKGMVVKTIDEIMGKAEGTTTHHPIFNIFGKKTWQTDWLDGRVIEFLGVHTDYNYDCELQLTAGDFRSYHQVRAAMCLEYEENKGKAKSQADNFTQYGMYPLVDEEYFEYVMTLTTAWEAAQKQEPYVFIELGSRYGTWIVRAGAAFRQFSAEGDLSLLAVEGNCEWFQKMKEHVECNNLKEETDVVFAYAAPKSYNKVRIGDPSTYSQPRAVSLLEMLPRYKHINMMDFDIQGFEHFTVEEPGAYEMLTEKVGFVHFGTHGHDIERHILQVFQKQAGEWCVVYFFSGAHTKKLNKGHRCNTPYGPSVFNDGAMGIANLKYYPELKGQCKVVPMGSPKSVSKTCYSMPEATKLVLRNSELLKSVE